MDLSPENSQRSEKAYRAVLTYESDSSLEKCIADLLGDLRLLCDESGFDYAELDRTGYRNYLAELGDRDDHVHEEKAGSYNRLGPDVVEYECSECGEFYTVADSGGDAPEAGAMSTSDGLGAADGRGA